MEMAQYEARFSFKKMRSKRKQRTRLTREEKRVIGRNLYHWTEEHAIIFLSAAVKLAVCGGFGMLAAVFILQLPVSAELWAAACAGCLAYRWLGRLITIEPKESKTKKTLR